MTDQTRGRIFVLLQFILLGLLVFLPHGELWFVTQSLGNFAVLLEVFGLLIALMGIINLGSSLTATPVPKHSAVLRTTGLYAVVRHPIYLGIVVITAGLVLMSSSWWSLLCGVALVILLSVKARFEEKLLLAKFEGYAAYAARTGRIIPFVGRIRRPTA